MSYAAEPFSYVADQLLTALTGGAAREGHRFFRSLNEGGFALERPWADVHARTLTVAGISGEEFRLFVENHDFQVGSDGRISFISSEEDPLSPAREAQWPDEGTDFFVSYFHAASADAPLTDRNVGSLTRILAEAFGRELTVLRKQMETVYESAYHDTAEGKARDHAVALLGLTRRSREHATGRVRFVRQSPAPGDIFLPAGTRVSTAVHPAVHFETTGDRTLRRGQLAVEVDVRAVEKGPTGVVAASAITIMNELILGIDGVVNDAATVFGAADETDAELRSRATKVLERAGKATPRAMTLALAELPGLRENDIKVVEQIVERPGVVQVYVAEEDAALAEGVQKAILGSRPAGIRVEHNLAVHLIGGSEGTDMATDENAPDPEFEPLEITASEGFLYPLGARVLVFPVNPRITGSDKNRVRESASLVLSTYFDELPIGALIVYNRLVADLMAIEGVADVGLTLLLPETPETQVRRNVQLPEGQRALLDPSQTAVHFAGEFLFDFHAAVTLGSGKELTDAYAELRGRLAEFFATAPDEVNETVLLPFVETGESYSLAGADLTWKAQHDDSGLVLFEQGGSAAATPIPEGDRAVLRELLVEVKA